MFRKILLLFICFLFLIFEVCLFSGGGEPYSAKEDPLLNSLVDTAEDTLNLDLEKVNESIKDKKDSKKSKVVLVDNKSKNIKDDIFSKEKIKNKEKDKISRQKVLIYRLLEESSNFLKCRKEIPYLKVSNGLKDEEILKVYKKILMNIKRDIIEDKKTLEAFGSLSRVFVNLESRDKVTVYDMIKILSNVKNIVDDLNSSQKNAIENFLFCVILPMSKKLNFTYKLAGVFYFNLAQVLENLSMYDLANEAYLRALANYESSSLYESYIMFLYKHYDRNLVLKIIKQYLEYLREVSPEVVVDKANYYIKKFKNSGISKEIFEYLKIKGYIRN